MSNFNVVKGNTGLPIKMWTKGVPVEDHALAQLKAVSELPFIYKWLAVMPDVHLGKGSTIGSVVATKSAVIPSAVGVDIGCGMMAVKTSLVAADLPDNLRPMRNAIENAVPHGRGMWGTHAPLWPVRMWGKLHEGFNNLSKDIRPTDPLRQLGTLGGGNHFVEVCLDETNHVWVMLHSGSRGVGNAIGTHYIEKAKREMERWHINLPNTDLAYFPEGSEYFTEYVTAVEWAQDYARANREVMMEHTLRELSRSVSKPFTLLEEAINCHHNYVSQENHYNQNVYVTRKGAVRARKGDLGIIPGSMGAKSFIVRGLGNKESFCSCSHGAGRVMSRTQAKKEVSLEQHVKDTQGVECRVDPEIVDETPSAYKDIDKVMEAQTDLVEVMHTLKQILCVKG